ncbi:MAG TPA: hypothetical protein VI112_18605 [Bacteroidia bacterium]|jgi:hypothetical protein
MAKFREDSLRIVSPKPVRLQFKFDTRSTFVFDKAVNLYGYDAGILVNGKLRLTLGYYRMDEQWDYSSEAGLSHRKVMMRIGTINSEMIYFQKRFLSLGFPLEPGVGYYNIRSSLNANDSTLEHLEGLVVFSDFGLALTFTPIRWFGLKGMVGYRKAILSSEKRFDFNGIFSSIALNIDMQEAIKDIKLYRLEKKYHPHHFKRLQTFADILVR